MSNLEIEYKTMLNKAEFNHLQNLLMHVSPVTQTNYYFDTPEGDMRAKKLSLRIRTFDKVAELTLKIPEQVGTMEYNVDLTKEEAREIMDSGQFPDCKVRELLTEKNIPLKRLSVLGHLTTIRRETRLPIGLLALDKNHYADRIDYELELEVEDATQGQKDFDDYLESHNISFKYAKSKVARFVATLQNRR
ncbi:CYTH domain-containing protein [Streptococcus halotolerans]|uniref:CYTH domain-containing protein n=1 Tax=Streptococcus halotolerans TaxID=1814128 RepID=UPI00078883FD|nr:CYTH domain-containing protein [Streptococcus halotolerans]